MEPPSLALACAEPYDSSSLRHCDRSSFAIAASARGGPDTLLSRPQLAWTAFRSSPGPTGSSGTPLPSTPIVDFAPYAAQACSGSPGTDLEYRSLRGSSNRPPDSRSAHTSMSRTNPTISIFAMVPRNFRRIAATLRQSQRASFNVGTIESRLSGAALQAHSGAADRRNLVSPAAQAPSARPAKHPDAMECRRWTRSPSP